MTHWVEDSVDCLLHGKAPVVQVNFLPYSAICWLDDCLQGCTVSPCEFKGYLHAWALHLVTDVCSTPLQTQLESAVQHQSKLSVVIANISCQCSHIQSQVFAVGSSLSKSLRLQEIRSVSFRISADQVGSPGFATATDKAGILVVQVRKRDNGHVSIGECSYPDADDPLSSPAQSPSINSIPPAAMAAAAAAAGIDAVSSVGSMDSDETSNFAGSSSAGLGPPTFGSSFISDDDPYAWAQKLRRIPDKVGQGASLRYVCCCMSRCVTSRQCCYSNLAAVFRLYVKVQLQCMGL